MNPAGQTPHYPEEAREWGGYWAATLGAAVGGVLLVVPGTVIGYQYGQTVPYEPKGDAFLSLGNIYPETFGFIGLVSSLWFGEVFGCWLTLRLRHFAFAGATAAVVGVLLVVIVPIGVVTVAVLTAESLFGTLLSAVMLLTTIPAAARWLVKVFTDPPEATPSYAADTAASRDTGNRRTPPGTEA